MIKSEGKKENQLWPSALKKWCVAAYVYETLVSSGKLAGLELPKAGEVVVIDENVLRLGPICTDAYGM